MLKISPIVTLLAAGTVAPAAFAQQAVQNFKPVTSAELANPSPNDWLSFSRTYDDQRFSPLNQITARNVNQLRTAWVRGLPVGTVESTPIVRGGIMYIMTSTGGIQAQWRLNLGIQPATRPRSGCCGSGRRQGSR